MSRKKDEEIRRKVMEGIKDPKKNNPEHRRRLEKDAEKARKVKEAQRKRSHRHTAGGDDVSDTGMFSS